MDELSSSVSAGVCFRRLCLGLNRVEAEAINLEAETAPRTMTSWYTNFGPWVYISATASQLSCPTYMNMMMASPTLAQYSPFCLPNSFKTARRILGLLKNAPIVGCASGGLEGDPY
ncbi:hypothetical protein E2C01_030632 [Portunus trituberculatus]|uniref:Uncharacterized protein n=1 Tax=Portunus trituberculatus TaxID=210409 RepID=A0A5B7EVV5_PORTR|nr:hypothetical protein [Portunus trituberculatus]